MKGRLGVCVDSMKTVARTYVIATCLATFAGTFVGGAAAAPDRQDRQATLRVVALQPVKIAGSRFVSRESVRLTVSTAAVVVRRTVLATRRGTFVVQLTNVSVDRCNGGLTAVARGARGSFASTKVLPLPLCPPGS